MSVEGAEHTEVRMSDTFEDAMPGYHEEAEDRNETEKDAMHISLAEEVIAMVDDVTQAGDHHGHRPRPPNSTPAPTPFQSSTNPQSFISHSNLPVRASSTAPSSTNRRQRPRSPSPSRSLPGSTSGAVTQSCPICSKTMVMDNDGLNAHIDFCLSKEAIREAQASPATDATSNQTKGFKPKSIAGLISGSSKKRVVALLPGLVDGAIRKRKKR